MSLYYFSLCFFSAPGGENDDDVLNSVYYLTEDERWEKKDEMVTGVTETSIHSCYTVMDIDMDGV